MPVELSAALPSEYERLQVGVALYDPSTGVILDANERFQSLLGYDTETLRELSVESYSANTYPDVNDDLEDRLRTAAAGVPQEFDWRIKRSDGTLIWVQVHLSKLSADGRPSSPRFEISRSTRRRVGAWVCCPVSCGTTSGMTRRSSWAEPSVSMRSPRPTISSNRRRQSGRRPSVSIG